MSGKKKILLVIVILLIGVAFIGIGVAVTNSTVKDTQTTEASENEDKKSSTTGNVGDKEAAEKMIDQTVTREEIEEKVGEWNDFELDGNGCERGVYAGKFYYDNIRIKCIKQNRNQRFLTEKLWCNCDPCTYWFRYIRTTVFSF